jgi:hypothetical protein
MEQQKIGVYGPLKSGKTSFVERLAFPDEPYNEPYQGYSHEISVETEIDNLLLVDYPEGHYPCPEDKCDRVVVLVNRSKDKWEHYRQKAVEHYGDKVYLVYSLIDGKAYSNGHVHLDENVYRMSSKTRKGANCVRIHIINGTHKEVKRKIKKIRLMKMDG